MQGIDQYYYYAILDEDGDFTPSTSRVGIDKVLQSSKKLTRSKSKIDKLKDWQKSSQETYKEAYSKKISPAFLPKITTTTKKIGVILVDFPSESDAGYEKSDFDDLIFSSNTWTGTGVHPEGHTLYGSVYDYYYDQLNVQIKGKNNQPIIVNNPGTDPDYPEWMTMNYDKSYYKNMGRLTTFNTTIIAEAEAEFGSSLIGSFDVLVFIYAGYDYGNWKAHGDPENYYHDQGVLTISEKELGDFRNIGGYCHELGHAMYGFSDEYLGSINPGKYSLMATGDYNGDDQSTCPAPISSGYKIDLGLSYQNIARGTSEVNIYPGNMYKFAVYNNTDEYFVVEKYYHTGWYRGIGTQSENDEEGVTIWHFKESAWSDFEEVEFVNYDDPKFGGFGILGAVDFNDYTSPSSKLRSGALSDIALNDIVAKPSTSTPPASQYGQLAFDDPTPKKPTNLNLSGSAGQNPTITWSSSNEPDISHYVVKKRYVWNSGGTTTRYSNTTSKQFTDYDVTITYFGDLTVYYSVKTVDAGGNQSSFSSEVSTAGQSSWKQDEKSDDNDLTSVTKYNLHQNYPNPFNPSTTIYYEIAEKGHVLLKVYNTLGKEVVILVDEHKDNGAYSANFDTNNLPSGIYFYKIQVGEYTDIKKMLFIK